jgi:hypothetical protein
MSPSGERSPEWYAHAVAGLLNAVEQCCARRAGGPQRQLPSPFSSLSALSLSRPVCVQTNDYLIAAAVATGTSITKRFYFSADGGVTFARLTPADEWVRDKVKSVFSKVPALLFTGNVAHEYRDPNAPADDPEDQKSPAGTPPHSPKEPKAVDPSKRYGGRAIDCVLQCNTTMDLIVSYALLCWSLSALARCVDTGK